MTNDIEHRRPAAPIQMPVPPSLSQSTVVEASRAVAEVQAMVVLAQQQPRDIARAMARLEQVCRHKPLAEKAFFSYRRGGDVISGESIHLAREIARCWGNLAHGIAELDRDDVRGQSEILAFAWDVETNVRTSNTFILPHRRDTSSGPKYLSDMRDIYENNANNGARRLREAIFAVVPRFVVDAAAEMCRQTLDADAEKDLGPKIDRAVKAFERKGVTLAQLEAHARMPRAEWTGKQFTDLDILFGSIKRNEITLEEAFGTGQAPAGDAAPQQSQDGVEWPETAKPADAVDADPLADDSQIGDDGSEAGA